MTTETPQLEWLVIALVYNHQYYDELYKATFPDDEKNDDAKYVTMEEQKQGLVNAFKDIPHNDKIKLLIIENKLTFKLNGDKPGIEENWFHFEKQNSGSIEPLAYFDDVPKDGTMTKGKPLGEHLRKITTRFNAKRNILITFGHGSILGINLALQLNSLQLIRGNRQFSKELRSVNDVCFDKVIKKFSAVHNKNTEQDSEVIFSPEDFKCILDNTKQDVILSNKELDEAIKIAYNGKKLDVLVMYNCLMQNIYMQYELRNSVQYLVAPVTGISFPGYNYRSVFTALQQDLSMDTNDAAKLFLKTINDDSPPPFFKNEYPKYKSEIEGTWKIVSTELDKDKLEKTKEAFSNLFKMINNISKTNQYVFININTVLQACFNYAHYCLNNSQTMIDLLTFCRYFIKLADKPSSAIKDLVQPAQDLEKSLESLSATHFMSGQKIFGTTNYFVDMEDFDKNQSGSPQHGFGFLLQKERYPEKTIQRLVLTEHGSLSDEDDALYPSFLQDSGFDEFYQRYSTFNQNVDE